MEDQRQAHLTYMDRVAPNGGRRVLKQHAMVDFDIENPKHRELARVMIARKPLSKTNFTFRFNNGPDGEPALAYVMAKIAEWYLAPEQDRLFTTQ